MRAVKQTFVRALILMLATSMLASCGGKEERKEKYMERGKAFFAEKNYDKARIEFKNVLQIDPKTAEALLYIGEIEEANRNWPRAFNSYEKAVSLDPELMPARIHLAKFYLAQAGALREQGNEQVSANALGLAQEQVKEILAREPQNLEGLTLEATLWANDGDMDKAAAQLQQVIAKDPGLQSAAVLLASIYDQKEKSAEAESVLLNALEKSTDKTALRARLATFYRRHEQNDKAEEILRALVRDNPDELGHRVSLAAFLAQIEALDKAETVLRESIAAAPDDAQRYMLLAEFLSAKRGNQVAIDELKRHIQEKPGMSELALSLVKLYLATGQMAEARSALDNIIANHGDEPVGNEARVALAQMIAAENPESEQITALVAKVLENNPRDNDALLLRGKLAARKGDYVTAIGDFRSVLKDQPNSAEVLQLLAAAHVSNDEMELARDTMMRAIGNNPADDDLRMSMAQLLFQASDIDGALEHVQAVLERDRYNERALTMKFELLARKNDVAGMEEVARLMQAGIPEKEDGFIREARLKIAQQDYAAAMSIVDKMIEKNPTSIPARLAKLDVLVAQEKLDEAVVVADGLQEVSPDNAVGYFRKGQLLERKGDATAALVQYEKGLERDPESTEILTSLVNLEVREGGAAKATQRLRDILSAKPSHGSANEILGIVYMGGRDYVNAEQAFMAQQQVSPESAVVYAQLAQARMAQENLDGAAQAYKEGLETLPGNVRLLIGLAGVEEARRNFDTAISLYEEVLADQPDNAVSINNLAALLSDHRQDEASLGKAVELAAKLERTNQPAFVDTAGWVYYRKGDYDKAIEILKGVVAQAPKVPVFRYHLGMAYYQKGDKEAAREHLSKATDGDYRYGGFDEAKAVLETL